MTNSLTKVIYKPDTQSTDEFTVIVKLEEYKKWKAGDTTIPLTEVLDSYKVFFSNQGAQGLLVTPSNQQLDTVFGSHKDDDVVAIILKEGREQAGERIKDKFNATNLANGSAGIDTRGKSSAGTSGR